MGLGRRFPGSLPWRRRPGPAAGRDEAGRGGRVPSPCPWSAGRLALGGALCFPSLGVRRLRALGPGGCVPSPSPWPAGWLAWGMLFPLANLWVRRFRAPPAGRGEANSCPVPPPGWLADFGGVLPFANLAMPRARGGIGQARESLPGARSPQAGSREGGSRSAGPFRCRPAGRGRGDAAAAAPHLGFGGPLPAPLGCSHRPAPRSSGPAAPRVLAAETTTTERRIPL